MSLRSEIHVKLSKTFLEVFKVDPRNFSVEIPPEDFGDYSSNIAMVNAKSLKMAPRQVAEKLSESLKKEPWFEKITIAGPGFMNFNLSKSVYLKTLSDTLREVKFPKVKEGKKIQFEFVSANPTGPLTVGHGRQAIIGDVLSRVYQSVGYDVVREYYFNDAGRQMRMLGHSLWVRYEKLYGKDVEFEEDDYRGEYLVEVAKKIASEYGDTYVDKWDEETQKFFTAYARDKMFEWIKKTLSDIDVNFDVYFSESSLYKNGTINDAIKILKDGHFIYEKDGTTWFAVSKILPNEEDRVIVRKTGEPTYFFSDIAYMLDKYRRGFDKVFYIWGADHHGYIPRMQAAARALNLPKGFFNVIIHQFVTLKSGNEIVRMSKRQGEFTTLEDLVKHVGKDAARYFFAMLDPNTHLVFDVDLAESKKMDNPVYYIQYAYARISSLLENARSKNVKWNDSSLESLENSAELSIIREMSEFPEVILSIIKENKPQKLCNYAYSLAEKFHSYYNSNKVVDVENPQLSADRINLCLGVQNVLEKVLSLLGVNAPKSM